MNESGGQLNEISRSIGGLEQAVKTLSETQTKIFDYIKDSNDKAVKALADHSASDAAAFKILNDNVEDLKAFRNRVYAIAALIGTGAGAFWSYLWKKIGA
jgi:hypothetical protein